MKEETKQEEVTEEKEEISETDQLKNQIADLTEQVNKWKTDYYKVFADMENLKRRLQIEHDNALKFMMQDFASVLDK